MSLAISFKIRVCECYWYHANDKDSDLVQRSCTYDLCGVLTSLSMVLSGENMAQ